MADTVPIVLSGNNGGFYLSRRAMKLLQERGWKGSEYGSPFTTESRSDPTLVEVCRELGKDAAADDVPFNIVEVPQEDLPFVVLQEYDGVESLEVLDSAKEYAANLRAEVDDLNDRLAKMAAVVSSLAEMLIRRPQSE